MSNIAKIDVQPQHPVLLLWTHPETGVLSRIHTEISRRGAHPARTLVLLPYAQLLPLAQDFWAQCYPDGFSPRFETVLSVHRGLGGMGVETKNDSDVLGSMDIRFEQALDSLTAHALLQHAGVEKPSEALVNLLVQAVCELGPVVAGVMPARRAQWTLAAQARVESDLHAPAMAWEALLARVALQWTGASQYRTDGLFSAQVRTRLDCLIAVQGLAADPLLAGLEQCWGSAMVRLPLASPFCDWSQFQVRAQMALHACSDSEEEALSAAACVMRHIEAGHTPVALVSSDRALTRRMRALLAGAGVRMRDENGWKLSTTHSAAQVMSLLQACVPHASSDAVLNWLKNAPFFTQECVAFETVLRCTPLADWRSASVILARQQHLGFRLEPIARIRAHMQGSRTLLEWLHSLRHALQRSGMWDVLEADAAGMQVLKALRLDALAFEEWQTLQTQALWKDRRMQLDEYIAWVDMVLESANFQPIHPEQAPLVIAPLNQILARPFAAVVLVGCDEVRLNPVPELAGFWTPAQRAALGLPVREALAQTLAQAWQHALHMPACDVLWRTSDDVGETLLPSPLVQLVQLQLGATNAGITPSSHPVLDRTIAVHLTRAPLPQGDLLTLKKISASAYADLRQCPYRFFALRLLHLQSAEELEVEVNKRDFGTWLHTVLKQFHEALALEKKPDRAQRCALIDQIADAVTQTQKFAQEEFLPFAAAWPRVRDNYLAWLEQHEATGAVFSSAEAMHMRTLGSLAFPLEGRVDRIDHLPNGYVMVLDYKTEAAEETAQRVKQPLEDTQLAFYAALLPQHLPLQAGYVNVQEKLTKYYAQPDIVQARDALLQGMAHDMQRIAQGAALPALGEGKSCDFCQARGLCRKDFWSMA